ncbi:MAG: rRNA maturation RNase YbeY [Mongoliibacter sp.]|uniref:rRNA maturation RNase YbeY n=1 Tax=Mongoliibacter sp. TaxID=2022438 RepID=UPI0012F1241D|nr:rRNA maturation RNase YbeY [Mongoliibacter sp.]TVP48538.1 MAG: rRNA maturation RNase YbeY [Mongoliibacter sp.]
MAILFFQEDIRFDLKPKNRFKSWLRNIATSEGFSIKDLNYIFCTDEYLYNINLEYLKHDTYTDIITFDNSEKKTEIEGDIFVSIERIKDNAVNSKIEFDAELKRVLSHGLLHLMGYRDKTKEEKNTMRLMENKAIEMFE